MKLNRFFVALAFLCLLGVHANDDLEDENIKEGEEQLEKDIEPIAVEEEGDVLVLTKDNFDEVINKKTTVLVEFYAPWCGHCKQLAPEYSAAAKLLKGEEPSIALAKVDATVETELAEQYKVTGYPTLKFFKHGFNYDYEGPRDKAGIVSYMKKIGSISWVPPEKAVVTLTKENFNETINREELMLVEFYAPWCGHCQQLEPIYEKAAKQLAKRTPPIMLAKVDATDQTEIAQQYQISGYPTLKIFRKGKAKDYTGSREEWGIVNYMINQVGEAAKPLDNLEAIKHFLKTSDITTIGFFKDDQDPALRVYMDAANDLRDDFIFGYTFDKAAHNTYKVNTGSIIVVNPEKFNTKYEPKWRVLKPGFEQKDVDDFIKKHQFPLVGEYIAPVSKRYDTSKPLCFVFYTVDWSHDHKDATQLWRNKVASVAADYTDITFVIANEEENEEIMKQFNLDDSPEEINIGLINKDNKRYRMEPMEEFDTDEIREFLDKFKQGKLINEIRSQPVLKKQSGPVKVVVGKNFEEIVLDKTKDVLIEFYAPWCGHCKGLEPVYNRLAKKLKNEKNLVIAKMDSTANDGPDNFKVEGFPTIYYAAANNKENPIKYEGVRDVEDFETFLKEHATVSFGKSLKEEL